MTSIGRLCQVGCRLVGDGHRWRALGTGGIQDPHHVRRSTRLGDADDERVAEQRRDAIDRGDGRRGERDREPVERPEQVLGIDRGVVRAAARRDEHQVDGPTFERGRDALDRGPLPGQQPRGDIRLLADLIVEAHGHSSRCGTRTAPGGR